MNIMEMNAVVLLSVINTKLRDHYPSLEALCDDLAIDEASLTSKLESINYSYDPVINQFK